MSLIFRNLGQFPEETAHVLQNLVSANGLNFNIYADYPTKQNSFNIKVSESKISK